MPERKLYFMPGRGNKFEESPGDYIMNIGYEIKGRETISGFERLWFPEQLELIRSDIDKEFWNPNAILIGHSYGAYLLLHSLVELSPFPGRMLLFSPVLGAAIVKAKNRFYISKPPRAEKLYKLAKSCKFPPPAYMEIHTGEKDNACDPVLAKRFASLVKNIKLYIVSGAGHTLDKNYVKEVLRNFLRILPEDH